MNGTEAMLNTEILSENVPDHETSKGTAENSKDDVQCGVENRLKTCKSSDMKESEYNIESLYPASCTVKNLKQCERHVELQSKLRLEDSNLPKEKSSETPPREFLNQKSLSEISEDGVNQEGQNALNARESSAVTHEREKPILNITGVMSSIEVDAESVHLTIKYPISLFKKISQAILEKQKEPNMDSIQEDQTRVPKEAETIKNQSDSVVALDATQGLGVSYDIEESQNSVENTVPIEDFKVSSATEQADMEKGQTSVANRRECSVSSKCCTGDTTADAKDSTPHKHLLENAEGKYSEESEVVAGCANVKHVDLESSFEENEISENNKNILTSVKKTGAQLNSVSNNEVLASSQKDGCHSLVGELNRSPNNPQTSSHSSMNRIVPYIDRATEITDGAHTITSKNDSKTEFSATDTWYGIVPLGSVENVETSEVKCESSDDSSTKFFQIKLSCNECVLLRIASKKENSIALEAVKCNNLNKVYGIDGEDKSDELQVKTCINVVNQQQIKNKSSEYSILEDQTLSPESTENITNYSNEVLQENLKLSQDVLQSSKGILSEDSIRLPLRNLREDETPQEDSDMLVTGESSDNLFSKVENGCVKKSDLNVIETTEMVSVSTQFSSHGNNAYNESKSAIKSEIKCSTQPSSVKISNMEEKLLVNEENVQKSEHDFETGEIVSKFALNSSQNEHCRDSLRKSLGNKAAEKYLDSPEIDEQENLDICESSTETNLDQSKIAENSFEEATQECIQKSSDQFHDSVIGMESPSSLSDTEVDQETSKEISELSQQSELVESEVTFSSSPSKDASGIEKTEDSSFLTEELLVEKSVSESQSPMKMSLNDSTTVLTPTSINEELSPSEELEENETTVVSWKDLSTSESFENTSDKLTQDESTETSLQSKELSGSKTIPKSAITIELPVKKSILSPDEKPAEELTVIKNSAFPSMKICEKNYDKPELGERVELKESRSGLAEIETIQTSQKSVSSSTEQTLPADTDSEVLEDSHHLPDEHVTENFQSNHEDEISFETSKSETFQESIHEVSSYEFNDSEIKEMPQAQTENVTEETESKKSANGAKLNFSLEKKISDARMIKTEDTKEEFKNVGESDSSDLNDLHTSSESKHKENLSDTSKINSNKGEELLQDYCKNIKVLQKANITIENSCTNKNIKSTSDTIDGVEILTLDKKQKPEKIKSEESEKNSPAKILDENNLLSVDSKKISDYFSPVNKLSNDSIGEKENVLDISTERNEILSKDDAVSNNQIPLNENERSPEISKSISLSTSDKSLETIAADSNGKSEVDTVSISLEIKDSTEGNSNKRPEDGDKENQTEESKCEESEAKATRSEDTENERSINKASDEINTNVCSSDFETTYEKQASTNDKLDAYEIVEDSQSHDEATSDDKRMTSSQKTMKLDTSQTKSRVETTSVDNASVSKGTSKIQKSKFVRGTKGTQEKNSDKSQTSDDVDSAPMSRRLRGKNVIPTMSKDALPETQSAMETLKDVDESSDRSSDISEETPSRIKRPLRSTTHNVTSSTPLNENKIIRGQSTEAQTSAILAETDPRRIRAGTPDRKLKERVNTVARASPRKKLKASTSQAESSNAQSASGTRSDRNSSENKNTKVSSGSNKSISVVSTRKTKRGGKE